MHMRILTLNLCGLSKDWFTARSQIVTNGLRELAPDVVCLQEACVRNHPEPYAQPEALAHALGMPTAVFAPYGHFQTIDMPEYGGIAIIAKWMARTVRSRQLPVAASEPPEGRVALLVSFETPDAAFAVVNTHLSWEPERVETRRVQMEALLGELDAHDWLRADRRIALCGDLNNNLEDEPALTLAGQQLQDAYRRVSPKDAGYTWSETNPWTHGSRAPKNRRCDHIFVARSAKVTAARIVLDAPLPIYPSDHFGLLAEVEFP